MNEGHTGPQVASKIMETLDWYGIRQKLGYITSDNHGANDTIV